MKKTLIAIIVGLLLAVGLITALVAQTLPVDSRKKEMQFHRSFEAMQIATPADTLWRKVVIPPGTVELQLLPVTGAVGVRADSLYNNSYVDVSVGVPLKFPVYRNNSVYIRRTAQATASIANIIFLKM